MPVLIAGRPKAVASRNLRPRLGGVREDAVKTVESVLGASEWVEDTHLDVTKPVGGIFGANVLEDFLIINRLLIGEKLCELTARKYSGHNPKVCVYCGSRHTPCVRDTYF
jgi:hypothetical protein